MRAAFQIFAILMSCLLAACSLSSEDSESSITKSINPAQLSLKDAIKHDASSGGKVNRIVYVFVKPGCVFCKRLETVFHKFPDLAVYQFIVASKPAEDIQAEKRYCFNKNRPPDCDPSAIYRNRQLAFRFGIHAVPTMIFSDGTVRTGLLFKDELEEMLNHHSPVHRN